MKTLYQALVQPKYPAPQLGSIIISFLLAFFVSTTAHAAPPATVASCEGIQDAYPILGTQCQSAYAKINHAPTDAASRLSSFLARKAVLQIFQKALLCNGMYGASSASQQSFKSGEEGHLTALANLRVTMTTAGDPNIPAAYTATDLKKIQMTKQQCK